jgi:hypothetical protein
MDGELTTTFGLYIFNMIVYHRYTLQRICLAFRLTRLILKLQKPYAL